MNTEITPKTRYDILATYQRDYILKRLGEYYESIDEIAVAVNIAYVLNHDLISEVNHER